MGHHTTGIIGVGLVALFFWATSWHDVMIYERLLSVSWPMDNPSVTVLPFVGSGFQSNPYGRVAGTSSAVAIGYSPWKTRISPHEITPLMQGTTIGSNKPIDWPTVLPNQRWVNVHCSQTFYWPVPHITADLHLEHLRNATHMIAHRIDVATPSSQLWSLKLHDIPDLISVSVELAGAEVWPFYYEYLPSIFMDLNTGHRTVEVNQQLFAVSDIEWMVYRPSKCTVPLITAARATYLGVYGKSILSTSPCVAIGSIKYCVDLRNQKVTKTDCTIAQCLQSVV